jgi:uncharacterized protein
MNQYVIYAKDYTDTQALDRRLSVRPTHLAGVQQLKAQGQYILGGAILDEQGQMIGSTMVLQFESSADFEAWYAQEPYIQGKVWEHIEVNPFRVAQIP